MVRTIDQWIDIMVGSEQIQPVIQPYIGANDRLATVA
jgi:hypothetical protein